MKILNKFINEVFEIKVTLNTRKSQGFLDQTSSIHVNHLISMCIIWCEPFGQYVFGSPFYKTFQDSGRKSVKNLSTSTCFNRITPYLEI